MKRGPMKRNKVIMKAVLESVCVINDQKLVSIDILPYVSGCHRNKRRVLSFIIALTKFCLSLI